MFQIQTYLNYQLSASQPGLIAHHEETDEGKDEEGACQGQHLGYCVSTCFHCSTSGNEASKSVARENK